MYFTNHGGSLLASVSHFLSINSFDISPDNPTVEGELTTFLVILIFIAIYYAQPFKQWLSDVGDRVVRIVLVVGWRIFTTHVGWLVAWISTFLLWLESWKHGKRRSDDLV